MSPKYNCAKLRFPCTIPSSRPGRYFSKPGKSNTDNRNTIKQSYNLKRNQRNHVKRSLPRGSTSWRPNKRSFVHRRSTRSQHNRQFHFHLFHLNRTALLLGDSNVKTSRHDQNRKRSQDCTRRALQRSKRRCFRSDELRRSSQSPLRGVWT